MKTLRYIILAVFTALLFCGCVRDKILPCPPLTFEVSVQDKNWSNIDEIEQAAPGLIQAVDENLPFRSYVSTLSYELRDLDSGESVASAASYSISHDGRSEILTFPETLPFGRYEITLWGNIGPEGKSGNILPESVILHKDGEGEADSVYHLCDTVDYTYDAATFRAGLRRTVGCLLVDAVNLPAGTDCSEKTITGISGTVSKGLVYSNPVTVHTFLDWGEEAVGKRSETCLGPSQKENGSTVTITLRDSDLPDNAGYTAEPVPVAMRRNELTVLRYDYDVDGFHIFILVNGKWETVHEMEVD